MWTVQEQTKKNDRLILCIHKYVLNSQVINDGRNEM
jgi:hypothetical protein